jgi:D-glycero-D-manno-heptose 1,7-bisphosphate phosphatase
MKQGIFFERDGILNDVRIERQHQVSPLTLEDFRVNEAIAPLLGKLKAGGFLLIATTNQPGLSRGYQSRRELDRMHALLLQKLAIDDILVCPHDQTDHCTCHKPKPGLFVEAAFKWHLDLDRSYVVSEKWQDAEAARTVGCTSLLLDSPWIGKTHHDFVLPDLEAIVDKIQQLRTVKRVITQPHG